MRDDWDDDGHPHHREVLLWTVGIALIVLIAWWSYNCRGPIAPAIEPTPTVQVTETALPTETASRPEETVTPVSHMTIEVIPTDEPKPGEVQRG